MQTSIIVPVHNSQETLTECLDAIIHSSYKNYELIVIDDKSTDNSAGIARGFPCRIISLETNRGAGASRNIGAREAKNDILLFIDSDIVIKEDSISKIIYQFSGKDSAAGVVGVYSIYNRFPNFLSQYKHMIACYREKICEDINQESCKTAFFALKKEIFDKYRFDESFSRASIEDIEFGRELISSGYSFIQDKSNTVEHVKRFTAVTFLKNQYNRSKDLIKAYLDKKAYKFYHSRKRKNWYSRIIHPLRLPISWLFVSTLAMFLITQNNFFIFCSILLLLGSIVLEKSFLRFCLAQKGVVFTLQCVIIYFVDGLISGLGVLSGILEYYIRGHHK